MVSMGIDTTRKFDKKIKEPDKDELNIKILKFIEEYTMETGYKPSLRRIGEEFNISRQTVHNRLTALGVCTRRDSTEFQPRISKENDNKSEEINRKILYIVEEAERRGVKRPTMRQISDEIGISLSSVMNRMIALGIDTSRQ